MSGQNWDSIGTILHLLRNKICPKCLAKMVCMEIQNNHEIWACMYCDLPAEPMDYVYKNICWSCGSNIDSRTCRKSIIPGMGYHCNLCGKDLFEWKNKLKGGGVYADSIKQKGFYSR